MAFAHRLAAWIRRRTGLPDRRPPPGVGNNYDWFMREISGDARHPSAQRDRKNRAA